MKRKPIAVIITDTHLTDTNHEVNRSIYQQAIALAKKLKLDAVEHAGDLFHSRKAQTQKNLNCLRDIFKMFDKECITLNIVVGNHDKTEYSIPDSFLDTYEYHPHIVLHTHYGSRMLTDTIALDCLSYFSDNEYVAEYKNLQKVNRKSVKKSKKNVLLTHIGVNGAVMNNGTVVETKIDSKLFKDYDLVLIGHYHDAQQMSERIKYIGASMQHNFGEKPVKGATVLYDDLSTEIVEFTFPKFLAYEINATELKLKDIEDLAIASMESGDNLRVILTGTKAEIDAVNKQRLMVKGIDVTTKQDAIEKDEVEESVVVFTDKGILEAFTEFCKKNELDEAEGLQYLKKAIC